MSTFWGNTDYGQDSGQPPPWTLRYEEGRGHFAVANRDFARGELICKEKPTTYTSGWHPFTAEQVATLNKDVEKLSEEERRAFFEMENVFEECDQAAGIYMTNSFDMTSTETSGCGMYLAIARLNHSCRPNAQQTHLPETKEEVLYATRPIYQGEEICDCYIELRQNTEDRQRELNEYYRFICACPDCARSMRSDENRKDIHENEVAEDCSTVDDENRVSVMRLDKKMMKLAEDGQVQKAFNCALEIIEVLEDPLSAGWSERYLPDTYLYVFHFSCSLYKEGYDLRKWKAMAEKYANKAYSMNVILQGPKSPDSLSSLSYRMLASI